LAGAADLVGDRALVERAAALAGEPLERRGQAGLDEGAPRRERGARGEVGLAEGPERGIVAGQEVRRPAGYAREAGGDGEAVPGVPDRRLQQVAPRHRGAEPGATPPVRGPEAVDRAGDGER